MLQSHKQSKINSSDINFLIEHATIFFAASEIEPNANQTLQYKKMKSFILKVHTTNNISLRCKKKILRWFLQLKQTKKVYSPLTFIRPNVNQKKAVFVADIVIYSLFKSCLHFCVAKNILI